jgi:putative phosphoesterase
VKLGILSDTHDELDRTIRAVRLLRDAGAEALAHCGDLSGPAIVQAISVLPCWFVFGNHDADAVPTLCSAAEKCGVNCLGWGDAIELASRKIGIVHGHITNDIRKVLAKEPEILLFGHLHAPLDFMADSVRRINPGALHRAEEFTVAILDLTDGGLTTIRVDE